MIERIAVIRENSEFFCSIGAKKVKHIRTVRLEEGSLLYTGPLIKKTCFRPIHILLILIIALRSIYDIFDILLDELRRASTDDRHNLALVDCHRHSC